MRFTPSALNFGVKKRDAMKASSARAYCGATTVAEGSSSQQQDDDGGGGGGGGVSSEASLPRQRPSPAGPPPPLSPLVRSPSFRTPGSPMTPIPNLQSRGSTRGSTRASSRASTRRSFAENSEEPQPLTPEQVAAEIEALVLVLREASYTELEAAFHAGMRKQVGALQLSHLFATMGLSVSPEAVKEIERLADADGNGTLSKQEILDWLDGKATAEPSRRLQIAPPTRALERLGLLPGQATNLRHRLRSFHALSLFDSDTDGEVGVEDLRATWQLLMEENLTRSEARAAPHASPPL